MSCVPDGPGQTGATVVRPIATARANTCALIGNIAELWPSAHAKLVWQMVRCDITDRVYRVKTAHPTATGLTRESQQRMRRAYIPNFT